MRRAVAGVALAALLAGCSSLPDAAAPVDASQHAPPPLHPELAWLHPPDEHWFGVYLDGRKTGWSTTAIRQGHRDGRNVLIRRSTLLLATARGSDESTVLTDNVEYYDAEPPFLVLGTISSQARNGNISTLRTERRGKDLHVWTEGAGQERVLRDADYSLRDAFAVSLWLRGGARSGQTKIVRALDLDNLRIGQEEVRFVATHRATVSGVDRTWHELERSGPADGLAERELVAPDGTTLSWSLGAMELRAEPAEQARRLDAPIDLDLLGRARADRPLGDARALRRLVLTARGRGAQGLAEGPGQRIEPLRDDAVRVTVEPGGVPGAEAAGEEAGDAVAATLRFPSEDPRVRSLAAEATADAVGDRDKAARLLAFVARYVQDSYTECDHASVFQVIDRRTGDCSDHVLLFVALARAVSIPARPVLGLAWLGDDVMAFGPHEWCEVVVDGVWVPVDPTFGQLPADAARLRLSAEAAASAAVADLSVEVVEAVHGR